MNSNEWDYVQNRHNKENKFADGLKKFGREYKPADTYSFRDRNWLFEQFSEALEIIESVIATPCICGNSDYCTVCRAKAFVKKLKEEKPIS